MELVYGKQDNKAVRGTWKGLKETEGKTVKTVKKFYSEQKRLIKLYTGEIGACDNMKTEYVSHKLIDPEEIHRQKVENVN